MTRAPAARTAKLWMLCCVLAFTTTGCAQAIRAGLDLAGAEASDAPLPSHRTPLTGAAAPPGGQGVTSTYQHAPTLDWSAAALGRPFSLARGLFDVTQPPASCQMVSRGLDQVLPVPHSVPANPLYDFGFYQVGVVGNLGSLGPFLDGDGQGLGLQALAASSRLGTQGDRCAHQLFAYVSLGKANSAVMVLR